MKAENWKEYPLEKLPLTELVGKFLKRTSGGDILLKVQSISIGHSGTVYVHPGQPDTFGWTFKTSEGQLCGNWKIVEIEPMVEVR